MVLRSASSLLPVLALGLSVSLVSPLARADEPAAPPEGAAAPAEEGAVSEEDAKRADALFEEGRSLAAAGDHAGACPKFEESHKIRPGIGTLFNLAECHEKTGKLVLAYKEYTEVAERTKVALQADREKIARQRLEALSPQVPRVTISAPAEAKDLKVLIDGQPLPAADWNKELPMDPGDHVLRVEGGKGEPHEETFTLTAGGAPITLTVSAEEGVKTKRNTGLIVTGAILMGVGLAGVAVAGSMLDGGTNREGVAIGVGVGGIACLGVGIPLFIIGLKKKPVEDAEPAKAAAALDLPDRPGFVGAPSALSAGPDPFAEMAPGPVPAIGLGPTSATAAWRF